MLTLAEAITIIKKNIPKGHTICESYGEVQNKYVFSTQDSTGTIPPGDFHWTINKESGECTCEYLEREGNKPWSPIRGYKKLKLINEQRDRNE